MRGKILFPLPWRTENFVLCLFVLVLGGCEAWCIGPVRRYTHAQNAAKHQAN